MRKLRRKQELQDKRDRIRMGLLPPDPPKGNVCIILFHENWHKLTPLFFPSVRLANLMKVLTTDAIQDPTRVEARVRREVAMRRHTHEKMNAERKLTDEQRREKNETKKAEEDRRGVVGLVFRCVFFLFLHFRIAPYFCFCLFYRTGSTTSPTRRTSSKCARTQTS